MKALIALPLLLAAGAACADDAAILHCRSLSEAGARLACYDAIPLPGTPAAVPAPAPEQSFGMETVKKPEAETTTSIDSTIPGDFTGWGPHTQFKLANGQVWRVADDSSADLQTMHDAKVRIVRNVFGTMFLEIEGTNNSPKVRRVR